MPKLTLTFEVNNTELFDVLAAFRGNTEALGRTITGIMLTGEASLPDAIVMEFYGVKLTASVKEIAGAPQGNLVAVLNQ